MEFFEKYPEITIAIITLIGVCIGYIYRARKEKKENLNISLYLLLEIWHRLSVIAKVNFDQEFDELINELAKQLPEAELNEDQKSEIKKYFTPILIEKSHKTALSDFSTYTEAFDSAVLKLSKDLPFFAYRINSTNRIRKLFSFLDEYLEHALIPLSEMGEKKAAHLANEMNLKVREDALSDLEKDIKILSFEIGILDYISAIIVIRRRRKKLVKVDKTEIQKLVKDILIPVLNEFKVSPEGQTWTLDISSGVPKQEVGPGLESARSAPSRYA